MLQFGSDPRGIYGNTLSLGSGTVTASGAGSPVFTGAVHTLRLTLNVTAASGTSPTLAVAIQHSADGTTWVNHSTFTTATAATSERRVLSGLDRFYRASWTLGGTTPSFTFTLAGEAV